MLRSHHTPGMLGRVHVVAAAIVREGAVLAARRSRPARLAGGWEFPGGKVEDGESEEAALVRECDEELSVRLSIQRALGTASDGEITLVLYLATIEDGKPAVGDDHDELRWLARDRLEDVAWLPIDRELLAVVAPLLV